MFFYAPMWVQLRAPLFSWAVGYGLVDFWAVFKKKLLLFAD